MKESALKGKPSDCLGLSYFSLYFITGIMKLLDLKDYSSCVTLSWLNGSHR